MLDPDLNVISELLRESIDSGRQPSLTVISNSMAPMLRVGDQILLAPADVEQLEAGDVVVVSGRSELVTHRFWGCIRKEDEIGIVTRGDRSLQFDEPVPSEKLVARVIARRRNNLVLSLTSGPGHWLNRHLAAMVAFQIRRFEDTALPVTEANHVSEEGRSPITSNQFSSSERIIRRLLYNYARLLTRMVGAITRFQNQGVG